MLQNIPTHVIAGPLGAGKTTLIRHLLAQRPANERWAVLINEFGLVGLDAALLSRDEDGIAIGEVAGGCLCCVNGMPFQVGLGRLLRKSRPDRLFIEPSGLGHPLQLLAQLQQAPWVGVLTIQPLLMVVDAQAMARNEPLPEAQQQAFNASEHVVFNKSEAVDEQHKLLITNKFKEKSIVWTVQGQLPLSGLPTASPQIVDSSLLENQIVDNLGIAPAVLWADPRQPICLAQQGEGGWSASLRFAFALDWVHRRGHAAPGFGLERVGQFERQQAAHPVVRAGVDQRINLRRCDQAACRVVHQHPVAVVGPAVQQGLQAVEHAGCARAAAHPGELDVRVINAQKAVAGRHHHQTALNAVDRLKRRQRVQHHGQSGHRLVLLGRGGASARTRARAGQQGMATECRVGGNGERGFGHGVTAF